MVKPLKPTGPPASSSVGKHELDAPMPKGNAEPSTTRTLRCRTVAKGRLSQLNYIRDLPPQRVTEDESLDLSGETIAPNASEALLAALGSCLAIGIHANAVAQRIPINALQLELTADLNTTAVWGTGTLNPKTIGFESIHVSVQLEADAPRDSLEALVRHAILWSPVANTLHDPVHLDVTLKPNLPANRATAS
jgi:uncharacterized OsmC-like protein